MKITYCFVLSSFRLDWALRPLASTVDNITSSIGTGEKIYSHLIDFDL